MSCVPNALATQQRLERRRSSTFATQQLSENAVATQQRLRRRRLNALPQFPAGSEERKETVSKSVALLHARVLKAIGLSENAVVTQQRLRRRRLNALPEFPAGSEERKETVSIASAALPRTRKNFPI